MPKSCTNQQPTVRVRIHSPAAVWHGHQDSTFTVKKSSDFAAWAAVLEGMLTHQGYVGKAYVPFQIGFFLTAMNSLPDDVRRALAHGIMRGLGPVVEEEEDEDGNPRIRFELKQVFNPLVGEQETPSGLILPDGPGTEAIVTPGSREFQEALS